MPLYEYRCRQCEERFEKLVGMNPPPGSVTCPVCGAADVAKQYSTFAAPRPPSSIQTSCSPATGFR